MWPVVLSLLLVGVAPDLPGPGPGDAAFAIGNPTGQPVNLAGVSVTDGSGVWLAPANLSLGAGETAWIVGNETRWLDHGGPAPVAQWHDPRLALRNDGDVLQLRDADGAVLDEVAWGADVNLSIGTPGTILMRRPAVGGDGWSTGGGADDWRTPRIHRVGESHLDQPTFTVSRLRPYASPDDAYAVLADAIAQAQHRLQVHVYDMDATLVPELLAAAGRGVAVDVLVAATVVGDSTGDRAERDATLAVLREAGADVWLAGNDRYAYHHLKVLVADNWVAMQSENWVETGTPRDPTWGNRGWGVLIDDAAMADWFTTWLAADRDAWDTQPLSLDVDPAAWRRAPVHGHHRPQPAGWLDGPFQVTPVVCPDHCADGAYLAPLAGARTRAWTQQLTLDDDGIASNRIGWTGPDALESALRAAAAAGADTRVQASRFAPEPMDLFAGTGIDARRFTAPGLPTLHNKGIIADDAVLVGSVNGHHASRSANREVAVWLDGPGVADAYAAWFLADWDAGRDWRIVAEDVRAVPASTAPVAVLWLLGAAWMSAVTGKGGRCRGR